MQGVSAILLVGEQIVSRGYNMDGFERLFRGLSGFSTRRLLLWCERVRLAEGVNTVLHMVLNRRVGILRAALASA